jgi:hypothetical protein
MIARHETQVEKTDLWSALAAPLAAGVISWRQDGRAVERDGRWFARFVAYVDANTVRERLDAVVPGEWDLTLDLLPPLAAREEDEAAQHASFKARLQILGVIREDVGTGRDYKAAATDAFKRAAVRFGIAHELYAMEPNWVQVDGEGRFAKPLEDPQAAYARRMSRRAAGQSSNGTVEHALENGRGDGGGNGDGSERPASRVSDRTAPVTRSNGTHGETAPAAEAGFGDGSAVTLDPEQVACPKCGGRTWDNRLTKRNPKAPDFKCRDRSCDGVVWPPRATEKSGSEEQREPLAPPADEPAPRRKRVRNTEPVAVAAEAAEMTLDASPLGGGSDEDELPF